MSDQHIESLLSNRMLHGCMPYVNAHVMLIAQSNHPAGSLAHDCLEYT